MSGRKSSEVANVLAAGEKVRKHIDDVILEQIKKDRESIVAESKSIEKIKKTVSKEVNLSNEAIDLMGNKAKNTLEQYKKIQQEISNMNAPINGVSALMDELNKVAKRQKDADVEAREIRHAIANKHDYCTPEYEQAQRLVTVYKQCRSKQQDIQNNMMNIAQDTRKMLHDVQGKESQLISLSKQISEMNDIAKKRMASDEQRNKLKQALGNIDIQQAKKFLKEDFVKIKERVEKVIGSEDDVVFQEFSSVYGDLGSFCTNLQEKYEKWLQEKKDAESLMGHVEELEDISYFDPIEYYNNDGVGGKKHNLFDFLKKFTGNTAYSNEVGEKLKKAKEYLDAESFDKCMKVLYGAKSIVLQARDEASKLEENMLQKTELAGAIYEVMMDLRYDTYLEPIDGNPNNGYRVTSMVGDEIIDFDKIDIDDDGNYIVNIDHKESRSGTCGSSWKNIVAKMRSAGVPMTDVKKSGVSILGEQPQTIQAKPKNDKQLARH